MKKHTMVLTCIAVFVIIFNVLYANAEKNQNTIFEETVEFGGFYTSYEEPFTISEDTVLTITLKSDIKAGETKLKIYNADGESIYDVSGGHLDENVTVDIKKGEWFYAFDCYNGKRNVEAEDGSYAVKIVKS